MALTGEAKKCLYSMIVQGKEVENWGEARVAWFVAGVPKGKVGWRIVGMACTAKA